MEGDEAVERMRCLGERAAASAQVAKRQKALIAKRLEQITAELQHVHGSSKGQRLALMDQRYLAFIEESLQVLSLARRERLAWEHARMLIDARRSADSLHRARARAGVSSRPRLDTARQRR